METIIGSVVGALFCSPVIYCVFRLARYKKQNALLWSLVSVLMIVPTSLIFFDNYRRSTASGVEIVPPIFIFILLAVYPPVLKRSDMTEQQKESGIIKSSLVFITCLTAVLITLFYINISGKLQLYSLKSPWLYAHATLGFLSYSCIASTLFISIAKYRNNQAFPRTIYYIQLTSIMTYFISIICGLFWSKFSFGSYWSWDPMETWSLILIFIMIGVYTNLVRNTPTRMKGLVLTGAQTFVALFMLFIPKILHGLHAINSIF